MTPRSLVNPKSISAAIEYFFGRGELSQVVDQTNPLSMLTHERRLSALGPGGLNRKRAGFEVRDVHISHYGRICPIETPEGTNIGLISSLAIYAGVDEYGFLVTPYRKVQERQADRRDRVAPRRSGARGHPGPGRRPDRKRAAGRRHDHRPPPRRLPVGPRQPGPVHRRGARPRWSAFRPGLIPFLEHDDANRALMGSNMQRQAVPLLVTEPPLVATGMERRDGAELEHVGPRPAQGHRHLRRRRAHRNRRRRLQAPQVRRPQRADLPEPEAAWSAWATRSRRARSSPTARPPTQGELALGRNVLAAFMAWDGFNFEDAIIISEELVENDTYTSIHIEEFDIEIRETKLGREEFTRDIPNVSETATSQSRRERHRAHRHLRAAGRHAGRQGLAQVEDRADARREAAARHLRPRRRGREERFARSPLRRRRHRHRHAEVFAPHEPQRRRAQGVRGRLEGGRGRRATSGSPRRSASWSRKSRKCSKRS